MEEGRCKWDGMVVEMSNVVHCIIELFEIYQRRLQILEDEMRNVVNSRMKYGKQFRPAVSISDGFRKQSYLYILYFFRDHPLQKCTPFFQEGLFIAVPL